MSGCSGSCVITPYRVEEIARERGVEADGLRGLAKEACRRGYDLESTLDNIGKGNVERWKDANGRGHCVYRGIEVSSKLVEALQSRQRTQPEIVGEPRHLWRH